MNCRTGVRELAANGIDYQFRACGKPTTQSMMMGLICCHYCDEHGASARRWAESQGQGKIIDTQLKVPNALRQD